MAEKTKKRMSRRAQERLNRALRAFDLTMLGLIAVAVVSGVLCHSRGSALTANASSGFAYWYLVVVGYLPMWPVNGIRALMGLPIPAASLENELALLVATVLVWLTGLWLTIRIVGRRNNKSATLHIATRIAQIILIWGLFQLFCMATVIGWNRGGKVAYRHSIAGRAEAAAKAAAEPPPQTK